MAAEPWDRGSPNMTAIVAIIAPGNMGAAIGRRLTEHKVTVLTALAGRSAASVQRAHQAGMTAASDRQLAEADFVLSIVPPAASRTVAGSRLPRVAVHRNGGRERK